MAMKNEDIAAIFKAFSDTRRIQIIKLLQGGEKCACELIEELDIPQSTLSYHMKVLCRSGIVKAREEGKWTHYRVCPTGSKRAIEVIKKITAKPEK